MRFSWFLLGFLRGVAKNVVFFDGEFVVSLWWSDGGLWRFECLIWGGDFFPFF
jgi:hypothetical protein